MSGKNLIATCLWSLLLCAASMNVARADTIVLTNGGRMEGQAVKATEQGKETYLVTLTSGAKLTLGKAQVSRIIPASKDEESYQEFVTRMPDTVEGHWTMAEWCAGKSLGALREFHLQEIVRHDPDHAKARALLGFTNVKGKWVFPDEHQRAMGYEKYKGMWRPIQDVEISKERDKITEIDKKWRADVNLWRGWLERPSRAGAGAANLQAIRDHAAAPALVDLLNNAKEPQTYRLMYIDILGPLSHENAFVRGTFVNHVIYNDDEEIREKCLDHLAEGDRRAAGAMFTVALGDKKNAPINRAAIGIALMQYEQAIPALINALETKHTYTISTGSSPGGIGASFGGGGGTFSAGGSGPKQETRMIRNSDVQSALVSLTKGQNFGYDRKAWRDWYASSRAPQQQQFDLRRRP